MFVQIKTDATTIIYRANISELCDDTFYKTIFIVQVMVVQNNSESSFQNTQRNEFIFHSVNVNRLF